MLRTSCRCRVPLGVATCAGPQKNSSSPERGHDIHHRDPAGDAAPASGLDGRRSRRQARRVERTREIELIASHPDSGEARHGGPAELVQRIADELRAEGWSITWLPVAAMDAPAWDWVHPRWGDRAG